MPAVEVEKVECSPLRGAKALVFVHGKRRSRRAAPPNQVTLVVEVGPRHHRFPALPQPRPGRLRALDSWSASFAVPAWLAARLNGHMSLAIGEQSIPLPDIFVADTTSNGLRAGVRANTPAAAADHGPASSHAGEEDPAPGPQGEQTQVESIHADLRREADQLRKLVMHERAERAKIHAKAISLASRLAKSQAELSKRPSPGERGAEHDQLARELASLHAELADTVVSRDAARTEAAGLRVELDRLGGEVAAAREQLSSSDGGLGEAEALLAEARTLTAGMRRRPVASSRSRREGGVRAARGDGATPAQSAEDALNG